MSLGVGKRARDLCKAIAVHGNEHAINFSKVGIDSIDEFAEEKFLMFDIVAIFFGDIVDDFIIFIEFALDFH